MAVQNVLGQKMILVGVLLAFVVQDVVQPFLVAHVIRQKGLVVENASSGLKVGIGTGRKDLGC
jgi:hypothetical protein